MRFSAVDVTKWINLELILLLIKICYAVYIKINLFAR